MVIVSRWSAMNDAETDAALIEESVVTLPLLSFTSGPAVVYWLNAMALGLVIVMALLAVFDVPP
jgi:hypothetical protein